MATRYLPVLVGTPYAGLIVDRHDKRHVLMMTNTVLGLTSLAIGAAVLTHTVAMWQIFASATVFGVMACLDNPARMAFVPELVGSALIRPAVTTNSIMANVGRTLGPVVAAALAHSFGLGWCFVANAASFALVWWRCWHSTSRRSSRRAQSIGLRVNFATGSPRRARTARSPGRWR